MDSGRGLLAMWMHVASEEEHELNRWYEEYSAFLMRIDGFLAARLYLAKRGEPKYVTLYELAQVDALQSASYLALRREPSEWTQRIHALLHTNTRNEYELVRSFGSAPLVPAAAAQIVRLETDPKNESELVDWYTREHLPALSTVPGAYRARLLRAVEGVPKYLAVYEMSSLDIMQSDAWHVASATPWTKRIQGMCTTLSGVSANLIRSLPSQ
jgi:hypothetical protein